LRKIKIFVTLLICFSLFNFATCKYSFKDVAPIPIEIKNFRVQQLGNKAQYTNAQLSPQLTEKLRQKIINTTRLRNTNEDDAHYDISGYVSQYSTTTVNIQEGQAGTNRLTVGFHLVFKNSLDKTKDFEADVSRNEDFSASKSLSEAENEINDRLVKNLVDEIFNKIFSNW
jgi:outer membrane lipopolysaccharide assembly protein LptE/RlpB